MYFFFLTFLTYFDKFLSGKDSEFLSFFFTKTLSTLGVVISHVNRKNITAKPNNEKLAHSLTVKQNTWKLCLHICVFPELFLWLFFCCLLALSRSILFFFYFISYFFFVYPNERKKETVCIWVDEKLGRIWKELGNRKPWSEYTIV